MNFSFEQKVLGWALTAALLSLGSAWLATIPIKMMTGSSAATTATSSPGSSSKIVAIPELIAQGHQFYEMSCSHCHGDDATGDDDGPDLHNLRISNAGIARSIKKGIKGQMPNYAKKYDDNQIAAIVSYLRTLR